MSRIYSNLTEAIGNTPLIRLRKLSELTGCEILGKAEFLNPGQSIKDRTALYIIREAISSGKISPGGVIVEGTAGNTGIGLALVGVSMGLKCVIVIPSNQSEEKKQRIRLLGAQLVEVPPVPYSDPGNYVHYSKNLAATLAKKETKGVLWANQFDNLANRQAHYLSTGAEIWRDCKGNIDGFICAAGTGGTLAGVAQRLREENQEVVIGLADPEGSALASYYQTGELKKKGDSVTEGIGQGRVTANLEGLSVDHAWSISDSEALPMLYDLVVEEGLFLGGSSAINIAGVVHLAQKLGPGKRIVTILADGGERYSSKIYNADFLHSRNLPVPKWMSGGVYPNLPELST